jgi:hypothetical protein
MSEPEKVKRRFWQIHLSTSVVMMFVAGLMLLLNFRHGYIFGFPYNSIGFFGYDDQTFGFEYREWLKQGYLIHGFNRSVWLPIWDISINLLTFLAACLLTGIAFEYLIRRREGRKP